MKPQLVEKKLLRKLYKKQKFSKKYNFSVFKNSKNFLFNNWYILLVLAFCCFILFLKYQDTKKEKEKFKFKKIEKPIEKPVEKLSNSESYESDYYSMIQKIKPIDSNHPSLYS